MKRALLLGVLWLPLAGAQQNMAPVAAPTPPSQSPVRLASVDDAFAIAATQGGDAEIEAANIALARTSTDGVAAFARLMLTDHGDIAKEGAPLFRRHLARTPAPLSPADALAIQSLQDAASVDLDQTYAMLQIGDHLATRAAFATEARAGADPALRAFATKWLPTIDAHLQLAIILVKHVGGDTPFKR